MPKMASTPWPTPEDVRPNEEDGEHHQAVREDDVLQERVEHGEPEEEEVDVLPFQVSISATRSFTTVLVKTVAWSARCMPSNSLSTLP